MANGPYPVDMRAVRPGTSSKMWAVLTILLVKFVLLIPHFFCLALLQIARFIVFLVAQVMVIAKGEYPAAMFSLVAGVLRWDTRVRAFILSLSDVYPPFSLNEDDGYPVDVVVERPPRSSRLYAFFNLVVFIGLVAALGTFFWYFVTHIAPHAYDSDGSGSFNTASGFDPPGQAGSMADLTLRGLALIPHQIVLIFVAIVAVVLWFVVQWVILFTGRFPEDMYDLVAGYLRWSTRVTAYKFGLTERYPPFNMQPSLSGTGASASGSAPGQGAWPLPPGPVAPGPVSPAAGYWPAAPPLAPAAPAAPAAPSAPWPPASQP
jgi:hypothetical protein